MEMRRENLRRRRGALTGGASGSITDDQRSSSLCDTHLRLTARLTLVAAYSGRRHSYSSWEHASDEGLAASLISKMWSSLSMRGTIPRWWRLAMIEAAPSLASARLRSAVVSDSNLY
jgi:hypothetical protein